MVFVFPAATVKVHSNLPAPPKKTPNKQQKNTQKTQQTDEIKCFWSLSVACKNVEGARKYVQRKIHFFLLSFLS